MYLNALFWSKTKVDILKYLTFKEEGSSIRWLESVLDWSFPAIKKQIDVLVEWGILSVDKEWSKWQIYLKGDCKKVLKKMMFFALIVDFRRSIRNFSDVIVDYFFCDYFVGSNIWVDIVIIHNKVDIATLENIKNELEQLSQNYFIENLKFTFMLVEEYNKRQRLADRFVIKLMEIKKMLDVFVN